MSDARATAFGPPWSLAALLGPVSVEDFCARYWGREPLHVSRGAPDFYRALIRMEDVERQLSMDDLLNRQQVRLRRRDYGPFEYPPSLAAIHAGLAQGKSLQLRNMERFLDPDAPAVAMLRDMERALQHPKDSLSCYITPARGEALVPHHDESDIFTLQIEGVKRWRLYHQVVTERPGMYRPEDLGPPERELLLRPGDFLYHPRGRVHEVESQDEHSFSLTVVFLPITWKVMLEVLVEHLGKRPEMIEQLPAGALDGPAAGALAAGFAARVELVKTELARMPLEAVKAAARQRLRMPPEPVSQIRELLRLSALRLDSALVRRPELPVALGDGDPPLLRVGDADPLLFAPSARAALAMILAREGPFTPAELPGLPDEDRLFVPQLLVRAGLLRFA